MLTPPETINNNGSNGNSCSPSKSSSTCSSASPLSPSSPAISTPSTRKFIDEVWKDLSPAALLDHSNNSLSTTVATTTHHPGFCGMTLQDFLARSSHKDHPARGASSSATDPSSAVETTFLGSLVPPPATLLSLNSGSDFAYLETCTPLRTNPQLQSHSSVTTPNSVVSSFKSPIHVLGSSSAVPSYCKKRAQENGDGSGDRRHKRMIKNRESAARSRARKQAYTNELELEIAHLQEENARLRRLQEEVCSAAAAHHPRNRRIYRTLTAPF